MKEATGELSMTVVTIIAIVAILGILTYFLLPRMRNYISNTWGSMEGKATEADTAAQNMQ